MKIKRRNSQIQRSASESKQRLDAALKLVQAGVDLLRLGDRANAEAAWRRAVQLDPNCVLGWTCLTDFLAVSGRRTDALLCLDKLIACGDKTPANFFIFADKLSYLRRYDRARMFLDQAVAGDPSLTLTANTMRAAMFCNEGQWERGLAAADAVLKEEPGNLNVREMQLLCLHYLYRIREEIESCKTAIAHAPNAKTHSRMLFKLHYLPECTPEMLYEECRRWNDLYAAPLAGQILPHNNNCDPERRLKIGYLSSDFHQIALIKLLPGVLENHTDAFEVYAFSVNTKENQYTNYVRNNVAFFRALPPSMAAIAQQVRADEIDILVDLSGRATDADAFLAFALKPAPIQVNWLGAMATSGLTTMDYFIGDPQLPCPGTDHLFSEKIFRLKQHVSGCFRPLDELPVGPSPYFKNGYITFGCFNDIRKITLPMVQLWALVLHLHPTSKLLLKFGGVDQHNIQCRFVEWFRTAGVAPERLMFEGWSNKTEYMLSWNRVDIALDPFPYNGGTTSMDTLWMGVPLLSMAGRLTVSCAGASMLSAIGLPVARNAEQYLALSGSLVEAVQKAPDIRQRIRQSLINSPLMDGRGLMLELEAAYRQMWRDWCAQQKQSAGVSQPDLMEEIAGTFSTTSGAARNSEAEPSAAPGQHGSYSQAIQATSPTA